LKLIFLLLIACINTALSGYKFCVTVRLILFWLRGAYFTVFKIRSDNNSILNAKSLITTTKTQISSIPTSGTKPMDESPPGDVRYLSFVPASAVPSWSNNSVLDHRSVRPMFKSQRGHIRRLLFHLWFCFITIGGWLLGLCTQK